jgi:hypothetical protein
VHENQSSAYNKNNSGIVLPIKQEIRKPSGTIITETHQPTQRVTIKTPEHQSPKLVKSIYSKRINDLESSGINESDIYNLENLSSSLSNSSINQNTTTNNNYTVYATNDDYSTKTGNVYQDHDTTYLSYDRENSSNLYDNFSSSHYYTSQFHDTSYDDNYKETSAQIYDTFNNSVSYNEENTKNEDFTSNSYYQDHFALSNMLINDTGDVKKLYNGYSRIGNNIIEKNLSSANRTIKNSVANNREEITEISDISFEDFFNEGEEIDAEVQEIINKNLIENNETSELNSTIDVSSILADTALLHQFKRLDDTEISNNTKFDQSNQNMNHQFEPINRVVRNQTKQEDLGINFASYNETISDKVVNVIDKNNFKSNPGVYKLSDLIFS